MIEHAGRILKGAILLSGGGLSGVLGIAYATDDGTRRAVRLWTSIGPVIAHYRIVEFKQKLLKQSSHSLAAKSEWNKLHHKYSDHVLKTIQGLGGFYIKIGQVLASRKDLMPKLYIEKFRTLEDQVPHSTSPKTIQKILRTSLGVSNLEDIFEGLCVECPLGTASIGQVFHARLKENLSAEVAIKVQLPGVEHLFRSDIKTVKAFCKVLAPEQVPVFDEIERQFMTEFDYRKEARHLAQIHKNMKKFKEVVVPRPWLKYCTKEVLVMDYLPGPKLIDGIRMQGRKWATEQGINFEEFEREIMAKYEKEGLPPAYNAPNAHLLSIYHRFSIIEERFLNSSLLVYNILVHLIKVISLGFISIPSLPYYDFFIPFNSAQIMDILLNVHGHQILVDGCFNADPHGGNFLLLPDGRIGLIDYGQVKRYTKNERLEMAKIIAAMYKNDQKHIPNMVIANGYKSRYSNPDVIRKMIVVVLDRDGRDVTDGVNVQEFMDKMYALDPWEKTGDLFIMPSRVSFLLRSIGLMMNNPVSVLQIWGPIAEKVLQSERV
ncbi:unnamed protein product [Calypogeia fissa]